MIDGKNVFDQPIKNNKVTCKNIRKIATGLGDGYTSGCLLDYIYFKNHCKMIAIDLSKQQALDKANLDKAENTRIYLILEEAKDFSQGTVKVL